MQDQTPITWVDGSTALSDANLNAEIRNAAQLLLNPPVCSVHSSSSQSIPTGSGWTAIQWDTSAVIDTEAAGGTPMFSSSYRTRITIQTSGWYECIATARENSLPAANVWTAGFRINGSTLYLGATVGRSATILDVAPANLIPLNAGDYIEFVMTHDSGSAITSVVNGFIPGMAVVRRRGL